jgi:hypothetical protein
VGVALLLFVPITVVAWRYGAAQPRRRRGRGSDSGGGSSSGHSSSRDQTL